jgi:hypothetical protein
MFRIWKLVCHKWNACRPLAIWLICDNNYIDIDRYILKLKSFHVKSKTGITDKTFRYLKNCRDLKVLEVHTYDDENTVVNITDFGICDILKNWPKVYSVMLFSKTICITEKSVIEYSLKANRCPKVKHYFLSSSQEISMRMDSDLDKTVFYSPKLNCC